MSNLRLCRVTAGGVVALVVAAGGARAEAIFDPYAGYTLDHNSNLFAVPSSAAVVDPHGVATLPDTIQTWLAGAESYLLLGQQRFFATAEARHVDYQTFTDLDHNEYLIDLGLDWKLASIFSGKIEGRRQHSIVSFLDRTVSTLVTQTDDSLKGSFSVAVSPVWRLEADAGAHTLDSPLPTAAGFSLREVTEDVGINYVGVANLAYGIQAVHVQGDYSNAPGSLNYSQDSGQLVAKYAVSGLTTLNAAIGYTERKLADQGGSVGGLTGVFGYARQLTGKTSVNLQFTRAVNSYYNAGSSEVDTGGSFAVIWQATVKLGATLNFQRTHSLFEGQTLPGLAPTQGRVDNTTFSALQLRYTPRRWVTISPYIRRQVRDSNIALFTFTGNTYGVDIRVRDEKNK